MTMDISLIKQKIHFVVTNIPAFLLYIYAYLIDTKFFYPLCDLE
jgi:hypothetical protein